MTHGQVVLTGGLGAGEVIVGPRDSSAMPPDPMRLPIDGAHEVAAVGVLAPDESGRPVLHIHGALGRSGQTLTGCLREGVRTAMAEHDVQALVYPTWNNPPRLVGDLTSPHGNNSPILSPPTGFPAITVPMGFVWGDRLPAGLQIYGDAWSEELLIRIAYAYEQATNHRRPPDTAPPLTH